MIRRRASAALIAAALHSQMREKRPADGIGKFDGSAAKRLIISFLKCLNIEMHRGTAQLALHANRPITPVRISAHPRWLTKDAVW